MKAMIPVGNQNVIAGILQQDATGLKNHSDMDADRGVVAAARNCKSHLAKEATMTKSSLIATTLAIALSAPGGLALAAGQEPVQNPTQAQAYGSPLATPQERAEHRARMRAAKTAEEREKIRKEHHKFMKERARERGMNIPDEPPAGGGT